MIKPLAIETHPGEHPAMDFNFLREKGVEIIQQLAGKRWTDFNIHDPGVTILEVLCFAITELSYRTDFPIEDLLANSRGVIDYEKNAFFTREAILTTNPVTVNDYRKVLIDEIEGVQNVWLYPQQSIHSDGGLSGLYAASIQVMPDLAQRMLDGDETVAPDIARQVREVFVSKRNLCEDMSRNVQVLKPLKIAIEAEIMIGEQSIPEEVLANVYYEIENYMNNPVRFYTEQELIGRGMSIDEIYSGPFLKHGFVPDSELVERKVSVDPTELVRIISQVDGVLSVKRLKIIQGNQSRLNKPYVLPEGTFPVFDITGSEDTITLHRDHFELSIKRPVFRLIIHKLRERHNRPFLSSHLSKSGAGQIRGKQRANNRYHSIQNQFPRIYGIGEEGLLASAPKHRKAQAKQLKAYLLFFEQIMADYLGQLDEVGGLFSTDMQSVGSETYPKRPLYDVPDVRWLLKEFTDRSPSGSDSSWETFKRNKKNGYMSALRATESDQMFLERKNRLFDHLLARFNEFVTIYPVELHRSLYGTGEALARENDELKWKASMISRIPEISSGRVRAVNYLNRESREMDFERKMRLLLNIREAEPGTWISKALQGDHISVETGRVDSEKLLGTPAEDEEDGQSWLGEMPDLLITQEQLSGLFNTGRVISTDDVPSDAFLLYRQPVHVLKHALDIKNYRIAPNPAKEGGYLVLYKAPQDQRWIVVSRFPGHGEAMQGIRSMIAKVREINLASEGFYLLEHVLLRPESERPNFGFRFIAPNGQKLMEHTRWMSFKQREETITALLEALSSGEITSEKLSPYCKVNLYTEAFDTTDKKQAAEHNKSAFGFLKSYASQPEKFLSRLEMVVRGEDNVMIPEDFFSLRMSVILPTWPARFQDDNFRESLESLFRLNAPAHIKLNFVWMNVTNLTRFEGLYADWQRFMDRSVTDVETRNELRQALVLMLNKF